MELQSFEGKAVRSSGVEMPGASGGLNKALFVDAIEWHHGDTGVIAIEFEVAKVRFDPLKDTDDLQRVHVLRVTGATQVDSDLVADALASQAQRVEEAQGVHRLPYEDTDAPDPDDADDYFDPAADTADAEA